MTNSDRAHRAQAEAGLGLHQSNWFCAEDLRAYKPAVGFWRDVSVRLSPAWWHVSAYGDYDLATARALGLTCVFVERPHRRPGPHHLAVPDLRALADRLRAEPAAKDDRGCAVSRLPGAEAPRNAPALRGVTREVWNPRNLPPFPGVAAGGGNVWR